jgi:hypothetical protein
MGKFNASLVLTCGVTASLWASIRLRLKDGVGAWEVYTKALEGQHPYALKN